MDTVDFDRRPDALEGGKSILWSRRTGVRFGPMCVRKQISACIVHGVLLWPRIRVTAERFLCLSRNLASTALRVAFGQVWWVMRMLISGLVWCGRNAALSWLRHLPMFASSGDGQVVCATVIVASTGLYDGGCVR